ncbi:hypothetical protein GCM10017161_41760 [Thalassotalea marina]|uniref:Uncharacterized protein n=1 Tax=Thalassotalea marina TaxID=1673741 RepID=A0A919ENT4_9GAMM|nr:hypothetical protein GCM10017161_41760 [Thalassotalea marina]
MDDKKAALAKIDAWQVQAKHKRQRIENIIETKRAETKKWALHIKTTSRLPNKTLLQQVYLPPLL